MFTDRFLAALGAWQNGWREDKVRRLPISEELKAAVEADPPPAEFRKCTEVCYRKRFLVPDNPQNGGDLGPLFLNGHIEEGLAAWTTNPKFAQEFKFPLRDGAFSAVFAHRAAQGEVLVNLPALWADPAFQARVKEFAGNRGKNAAALMHFKSRQGEIIMDATLQYEEVYALCGKSSPFDVLCDLQGFTKDEERDRYWGELVSASTFPEEPWWIASPAAKAVFARTKQEFLGKFGSKVSSATAS